MLRAFWLSLAIFLFIGWIFTGTFIWLCLVRKQCDNLKILQNTIYIDYTNSSTIETPEAIVIDHSVADSIEKTHMSEISSLKVLKNDKLFLTGITNVRFGKSDSEVIIPISLNSTIDSLVSYLKIHSRERVRITGMYSEQEDNPTFSDNLGIARAENFGGVLLDKGLTNLQFSILSSFSMQENFINEEDTVIGGISLNIEEMPQKTLADPRDFYFDINSNAPQVDDELEQYIKEVITFIKENPDENLLFTGHTDSDGEPLKNIRLGTERARTIANYFISRGLPREHAWIDSKGESQPIASNDTEEGKSLNRRVSIQLVPK